MSGLYDLFLHPQAKKELDHLPSDVFSSIDAAIRKLQNNPRPVGVKKLEDHIHRVRIGKWRVIYGILDQERRIIILRVVRRSERTYKDL